MTTEQKLIREKAFTAIMLSIANPESLELAQEAARLNKLFQSL